MLSEENEDVISGNKKLLDKGEKDWTRKIKSEKRRNFRKHRR